MNVLVADPQEQTAKLDLIVKAFDKVNPTSTKETREKAVNAFLDSILSKQAYLKEATYDLKNAEPGVRDLLLFTNVSADMLERLRSLVNTMRSAHGVLIQSYVLINRSFAASNIGKGNLTLFKEALDDLKELSEDLHDRFFALPEDAEFQDLMSKLNDLTD